MKSLRSLLLVLLCALALIPVSGRTENLKVMVLLSDGSAPFTSFANVLGKSLPASIRTSVREHSDQLPADAAQADLIVAVGIKAAELATTQSATPTLAVMISKMGYEDLLAQSRPKKSAPAISAIYLDQPLERQLDFLHAALPQRRRIGLLYSADSRIDIGPLFKNIARRKHSLITQSANSVDELFASLENLLNGSDVLLAVPDRLIYSGGNIRNILLTSYRHNVPMIGLTQAYVSAGALCAIYSTPEQLAGQTGAAVLAFAQSRRLPEPQYADDYTISLNLPVSNSLGIELPPAETIRSRMNKAKEENP